MMEQAGDAREKKRFRQVVLVVAAATGLAATTLAALLKGNADRVDVGFVGFAATVLGGLVAYAWGRRTVPLQQPRPRGAELGNSTSRYAFTFGVSLLLGAAAGVLFLILGPVLRVPLGYVFSATPLVGIVIADLFDRVVGEHG